MYPLFRTGLILCFFIISVNIIGVETESLPEWFYKTSPANRIGAIGFSYKYTADQDVSAVQIARMNAIYSLKEVIGNTNFETQKNKIFGLILGNHSSINFSSGTLVLGGSYTKEVSVFEYVYFEPNGTSQTEEEAENLYSPVCDFKQCRPGWLCNQINGDRAGFLGISYRASNPGRQLEVSSENALEIIQYMLGVAIEGKERYYRVNSSAMKINYRHKSFSIDKKSKSTDAFIYTKAQCFAGQTLFSWKVSDDIPAYPSASSKEWMVNGTVGELKGAIGTARKDLTGFVSRQLKNAYEDGIAELSKTFNVNIKSQDNLRRGNKTSKYSENTIRVDYKGTLKPIISGVYMDENERMYVWINSETLPPDSSD